MYVLWFIEIYQQHITVWGNWCSIVLSSLSDHKHLTFWEQYNEQKQPENVMGFSGLFDCLNACGVI